MRELADARRRERWARRAREDYIEAEHKRGVQPSKTAEALQAAADELDLDEDTRRQLGVSEGSVHHALARRGAKVPR